MKPFSATEIEKYDNWTAIIYSQPGFGKTSMVKSLVGRTIVLSVDGMYHVLSGLENVEILTMDSKKPNEELANFYRYLLNNLNEIDNIVIDNITTFQKYWLNAVGRKTTSGMPEIRDYGVIARVLFDFVSSLKSLKKNVLIFAHQTTEEITLEGGGVYTEFQPDIRALDAIMGIVPIVGRLVIVTNKETQKKERIIVLQPTQATRAKDQLIGNLQTVGQMDLLPILQNQIKNKEEN